MAHDVFISHSSKDSYVADEVTSSLEKEGIGCWSAPRDILPGKSWGAAIVEAIDSSKIVIVIFSANSNNSQQVVREIEQAVKENKIVLPYKIDEVVPTSAMRYFLNSTHWLDVQSTQGAQGLDKLLMTVKALLNPSAASGPESSEDHGYSATTIQPKTTVSSKQEISKTDSNSFRVITTALAVLISLGVAYFAYTQYLASEKERSELVIRLTQEKELRAKLETHTITDKENGAQQEAELAEQKASAERAESLKSNDTNSRHYSIFEPGINRPGSDYNNFDLDLSDPNLCLTSCNQDQHCKAWTYVKPGYQGNKARCWLKYSVPRAEKSNCCTSGVK